MLCENSTSHDINLQLSTIVRKSSNDVAWRHLEKEESDSPAGKNAADSLSEFVQILQIVEFVQIVQIAHKIVFTASPGQHFTGLKTVIR